MDGCLKTKPFTPRPYQDIAIDYLTRHRRAGLWLPMGAGKTAATLMALDRLSLLEPIWPVLITAPLRVARSVWPDEVSAWSDFSHLRVSCITGTLEERLKALDTSAEIYTVNYEQLPWLVKTLGHKWPFKTVVADELTRLKSFRIRHGGRRAMALGKVAFKYVDRFYGLTGTPAPLGVESLWGQTWFVDRGERLGRTHGAFMNRWFRPHPKKYGHLPTEYAFDEVKERISDIYLSIDLKDYLDIKEPIVNIQRVDLPRAAMDLYRHMEKEMFADIGKHGVEAMNAASKTTKVRQIAQGACFDQDQEGRSLSTWTQIHDAKLDALESIIEEANGAPVLVAYHFKHDLARLKKRFPEGRALRTKRDEDEWNAGGVPLMFLHPESAGHGLSFQHGGNILVFFALDWNLENHLQVIERIGPTRQFQSGYDRPVYIYIILANKTIDDIILKRIETKRGIQDLLLEAMKYGTAG